jgi:hypothetical protein
MKGSTGKYPLAVFWTLLFIFTLGITSAFAASPLTPGATLIVRTMPSGVASPVNVWDSKPYTWAGNELQLWGNVSYDGDPSLLTYTWNFGDGTTATGPVTNLDNVAATHTYATEGTPIATLTVSDGTTSASSTVNIAVVPHNADVDKNLAIQRGLKNLYLSRTPNNVNGCGTYYWYTNSYYGAETGLAVLSFEDYGHRASNDHIKDIYADTVQGGLDAIFADLQSQSASANPPLDSDLNSNGKSLYASQSYGSMYTQGTITMALANTSTPAAIVSSCGSPSVQGMSYKDVLTDLVDYIAFAQQEEGYGVGGWRYYANYGSSDNSVTQWPVLGLVAAEGSPWNISPPSFVKVRLPQWIDFSQDADGGFGYGDPYSYPNIAKTGAGIIEMMYAGSGGNQANALNFIGTDWNTPNIGWLYENNIGDPYAMYAVKKGLQYAQISAVVTPPLTPGDSPVSHDWQAEYDAYLVANQLTPAKSYPFDSQGAYGTFGYGPEGSFNGDNNWIYVGNVATSFALLVMSPGLVELPPVAVAGPAQEVFANRPVSFDGSASFHRDPARHLVKYEWDFNYNGTVFNPLATGVQATDQAGYPITNGTDTQIYTVALRVTDDSVPPRTAIGTTQVTVKSGNIAPVANPGGPYVCATGSSVVLNGSKSYDPNDPAHCTGTSCIGDQIASYSWNLGGVTYTGVNPTIPCGPTAGTQSISLTVTDSFGKTATQSTSTTTIAVSNLQPFCYKAVGTPSTNRITGATTYTWQMKLQNKGNGGVSLASASWTRTSIPTGVTVIDSGLAWNTGVPGGGTVMSNDNFSYSLAKGAVTPNLSGITWDFTFTDAIGGNQHFVGSVPQGSLVCQ